MNPAPDHTVQACDRPYCHRCPDLRLHAVAEAPLRPLADLFTAAVLFDEIADTIYPYLPKDEFPRARERFDALRLAVRRLS